MHLLIPDSHLRWRKSAEKMCVNQITSQGSQLWHSNISEYVHVCMHLLGGFQPEERENAEHAKLQSIQIMSYVILHEYFMKNQMSAKCSRSAMAYMVSIVCLFSFVLEL